MHIYLRLRQNIGQQGVEYRLQHLVLCLGKCYAEVLADVPFGEQHQFTQQEFAVVLGQHVRFAVYLYHDQRVECVDIQLVGAVVIQFMEIGRVAEIADQQKTVGHVLRYDVRHRDAGIVK